LGGDRLPEQGFVRVFELDDRVFYHQGQGVELLGDFVLAAKRSQPAAADNLELSISGFRPSAALGLLDRVSATNSQLFCHSQLVAFANQQKVLLSYG